MKRIVFDIGNIKGKNINIRTGGYDLKNKNKALLLIHGAGMDGSIWQLQTRYLASKGIRTLALDLPGHGFSDSPSLKTIEQMSDRCLQLLNYLKIKSAVIVGHSMGSLITLEMAKKENKIIKAISLLGTSHIMPVHPDLITASLLVSLLFSSSLLSLFLAASFIFLN